MAKAKKAKSVRRSTCPIAGALDLLGDRWSLVIVRDLMFRGFREYGEFLSADEGIATNILAERLERLVNARVILRDEHPTDGKKYVYRLSEKGVALAPVIVELARWGANYVPDTAPPLRPISENAIVRAKAIAALRASLLRDMRTGIAAR